MICTFPTILGVTGGYFLYPFLLGKLCQTPGHCMLFKCMLFGRAVTTEIIDFPFHLIQTSKFNLKLTLPCLLVKRVTCDKLQFDRETSKLYSKLEHFNVAANFIFIIRLSLHHYFSSWQTMTRCGIECVAHDATQFECLRDANSFFVEFHLMRTKTMSTGLAISMYCNLYETHWEARKLFKHCNWEKYAPITGCNNDKHG